MTLIGLAFVVVWAQLTLGGLLAARIARACGLGSLGFLMLTPLFGIAAVGAATLAAGHVRALSPWLLWILAVAGMVGVILDRRIIGTELRAALVGAVEQWRRAPISVTAVAAALVLAALASLAPPSRVDEVEYHWAAPLEWADAGRWIDSSYRHVDSFALMEIAYTLPATVSSYAGAHLIHLTTLVSLGLGAALAARSLGVHAIGAVAAAAMAMPVVWDQAYVAYNDTAVGGFAVAAAGIALAGRMDRRRLVIVAILLSVAISIKPTAVGSVGVVGLIILLQQLQDRGQSTASRTMFVARQWAWLAAAALTTLAAWSVRRFWLTGTWFDPYLTREPTVDELSRLPSTADQLMAPIMPFVLGVLGSAEPWGGRTAVVLQVLLLPALIYALVMRGSVGKRFALAAVPAWAHWIIVGLVGVRTRFHLVSWALLVVAVRVVAEDAARRWPRLSWMMGAAWATAVVLGVVDVSFEMVRAIRTIEW